MFVRFWITILILPALLVIGGAARAGTTACADVTFQGSSFTICQYDTRKVRMIRTYLYGENGKPYGTFKRLETAIKAQDETLLFAMNGGMYHDDRSAVGLYIENGRELQSLNTNKGPGNFHMLPNGLFVIWQENGSWGAHILTANDYKNKMAKDVVAYATQSGPMLVIDGKLHPKFRMSSTSNNIRNGVGVKGDIVYFAISNERVNFHTFASLFKDHLKVNNALYLDGVVSKMYAPELGRHDKGRLMGPMIAVTREGGCDE